MDLEIDVQAAKELLDSGTCRLVDCRESDEYEVASIEGSILLPMSQWNEIQDKLAELKGQHIVVHCHHGMRSMQVVQWMRQNGFPESQSMAGGISAWSSQVDPSVPQY